MEFSVLINRIVLYLSVFFHLPNLFTYLCPLFGQHKVDEDVVPGEVCARHHAIGQGIPAGVGLPVTNLENIGVSVLLPHPVTGNDIRDGKPDAIDSAYMRCYDI